jgi:hypothetical protein
MEWWEGAKGGWMGGGKSQTKKVMSMVLVLVVLWEIMMKQKKYWE